MAKRKIEVEEIRAIKDVPTGSFVRIIRKKSTGDAAQRVYRLTGYDRSDRKYELTAEDDCCSFRYVTGAALVLVGFTY